jgi:hypothetical protein
MHKPHYLAVGLIPGLPVAGIVAELASGGGDERGSEIRTGFWISNARQARTARAELARRGDNRRPQPCGAVLENLNGLERTR